MPKKKRNRVSITTTVEESPNVDLADALMYASAVVSGFGEAMCHTAIDAANSVPSAVVIGHEAGEDISYDADSDVGEVTFNQPGRRIYAAPNLSTPDGSDIVAGSLIEHEDNIIGVATGPVDQESGTVQLVSSGIVRLNVGDGDNGTVRSLARVGSIEVGDGVTTGIGNECIGFATTSSNDNNSVDVYIDPNIATRPRESDRLAIMASLHEHGIISRQRVMEKVTGLDADELSELFA